MPENQSEVARLLAKIGDEYEAAKQALYGLSLGVGQHSFITARMENLGALAEALEQYLPHDQAWTLLASELDKE